VFAAGAKSIRLGARQWNFASAHAPTDRVFLGPQRYRTALSDGSFTLAKRLHCTSVMRFGSKHVQYFDATNRAADRAGDV
jgi:hypothetical protein